MPSVANRRDGTPEGGGNEVLERYSPTQCQGSHCSTDTRASRSDSPSASSLRDSASPPLAQGRRIDLVNALVTARQAKPFPRKVFRHRPTAHCQGDYFGHAPLDYGEW